MKLLDDLPQIVPIEMGVYLCCSNRFMPKHFLNGAEIGASLDQVCGKGMSECVRTDRFIQSDLFGEVFNYRKDHDAGKLPAVPV